MGEKNKRDTFTLILCIGWMRRTSVLVRETRRPTQQASNPIVGNRCGAENGIGLPTLGNSAIWRTLFPLQVAQEGHYQKTSRRVRPAMRLKDTLILVERRKIALVSALSQCWLPYTF